MNKIFTKIVGAALGLAMAIGVGVAVASNTKEATPVHAAEYTEVHYLNGTTTHTGNAYAEPTNFTEGKVGWSVTGNTEMNPWRIGGKGLTNVDREIKSTTSVSSENISKVEVFVGATGSSLKLNSVSLKVGTTAENVAVVETKTSNLTSTTLTFERPSNVNDWTDRYFVIVFNVTRTSTSGNGYVQCSGAKFYKTASTPATSISLASANYTPVNKVITLNVGDGTDNSVEDTLTATVFPDTATDKTVTWSSDNEDVAVVIDGDVLVNTSAEGEATITASANGGTNVTDTMTYSVIDPSAATLDHVTVTGSAVSPQYAGNSFNYTGLTFTAVYDDESSESITGGDISWNTLTEGNAATGTYTAGGKTVDVSVPVTVLANPLTVSITGSSLTKTSYATNESWTYAPLTASGSYADGSSYTGSFTWSYNYPTPADMGIGDGQTLRITATASSNESAYVDVTVNVTAPTYTNTTSLTPGDYYIAYNDSSTKHYISSVASGKGATTTTKADGLVFTFSLVGNDTWEIKNGDNYLGVGTSSTSLSLNETQTTLAISWENEASGTRVIKGSSGRDLAWYASNKDIRTYSGKTDGTNGMTLEVAKTVSNFSVYSTGANKNVLKGSTFDAKAAAAAGFQARLNYTDSTYDDVTSAATWTLDTSTTGTKTLTVSYLTYTDKSVTDMNVYVVTIKTLSVNASGAKTSYVEGEQLNTAELVITGYEQDSTAHPLAISDCSFSPENGATLATSDTTVTVTYTNEDSTTATTTYPITVSAFVGYTKVTSESGLNVGESYVLGLEHETHGKRLMSNVSASGETGYRTYVDASDAFNSDKTTVTKSGAEAAGAVVVTLLSDGDGKYAFYDITNNKYLTGHGTDKDNCLHDSASLSDAGDNAWWTISFTDSLMSVTLNGSTRVLGYNISSPRFSTYASYTDNTSAGSGTAHPVLFKMAGSSVKTSVTSFANTSLKMNDPAYEGDITTPNCASNYAAMKTAYTALSDAEKNVFQYSDDYSAARARLVKWAEANGESFTFGATTPFASAIFSPIGIVGDTSNTIVVIVVISLISMSVVGGYFFIRKRKELH